MKIYKTAVVISGAAKGVVQVIDTIEHEGKMWLVPKWIDKHGEGWSTPTRIICLDVLGHHKSPGNLYDFVLSDPIPKAVCDGQIPPELEDEYVVIEAPDIKVPRIH